jgi:hypothetical protein
VKKKEAVRLVRRLKKRLFEIKIIDNGLCPAAAHAKYSVISNLLFRTFGLCLYSALISVHVEASTFAAACAASGVLIFRPNC